MTTPRQERAPGAHDRLLAAAVHLFASKGYSATTVRDLARAASVNLASVGYYFGSKRHLYYAALQHTIGPMARRVQFVAGTSAPPLTRVERIVRAFFDHIRAHPEVPALVVREMASGGEIAAPITQMMGRALALLVEVIQEGQKDGSIRPGDPLLLALSTVAQPVYLNLARRGIAAATGLDQDDPSTRERVVEHAVGTVRAALASHR